MKRCALPLLSHRKKFLVGPVPDFLSGPSSAVFRHPKRRHHSTLKPTVSTAKGGRFQGGILNVFPNENWRKPIPNLKKKFSIRVFQKKILRNTMKQKTDGVFFPGCSFGRIHPYKNSQKARLKSGVEKKRWHLMLVFKRQQRSGQPKVKAFIWKPLEDLDHTKLMLVTVLPMFLWSFKKMCFPICIIISVNSYELFYLKNNLVFPPKIIRRKKKIPAFSCSSPPSWKYGGVYIYIFF